MPVQCFTFYSFPTFNDVKSDNFTTVFDGYDYKDEYLTIMGRSEESTTLLIEPTSEGTNNDNITDTMIFDKEQEKSPNSTKLTSLKHDE